MILETFEKHEGRYGYRRIHAELRALGYTINHKKVQQIMKKLGLLPIIQKHAEYRTTIHSDQGWHYQHITWVKTLSQNRIFQSMSRKATCADNAVMENFFSLLKQEMYYGEQIISFITNENKRVYLLL
ncbi:IS3 family transposase [Ureibacillus composti]|nr:IS3 family transposase [Ureibacillus composti]